MATADLTVLALGRPDASAGEYIAEIQRRLGAQERVRYRMHAHDETDLLDLFEAWPVLTADEVPERGARHNRSLRVLRRPGHAPFSARG